jgi:hypothetical protein
VDPLLASTIEKAVSVSEAACYLHKVSRKLLDSSQMFLTLALLPQNSMRLLYRCSFVYQALNYLYKGNRQLLHNIDCSELPTTCIR